MNNERGDFKDEAERLEDLSDTAIGELADPPVFPSAFDDQARHGVDLSPDTLITLDSAEVFAAGETLEPANLDLAREAGGVDLGEV